ncbi:MAG TPA: 3-oxoacyl-ACP reductase FabG [Sporichthya sp.]|nr:3-oxoacyl-ACP reductase FabG [Sporichthya sp.]
MNITYDFTGRVVLVTGAAQGIGLAVSEAFLASGALLVALDRDDATLKAAFGDRDNVLALAVDVADADAVAGAVAQAVDRWERVDVAVNNAGITRDTVVWKMSDSQWREVLDVHLSGTFHVTRAVIPHMRKAGFGRIINLTSYTGLHGNIGQANYAAAKAGLIGFTKTVAKEVATFGITVNAISPAAATAMVAAVPPDKLALLLADVPQGRFADPSEIASAVSFLASAEAGYITGVVLPVDGGTSM